MIAIGTFIVVALISLVLTRLATGALIATGLPPDVARFQARSAFTTVGFTTDEAESAVNHPTRRRVVAASMLVGSLGTPTLVVTVVLGFAAPGPGDTEDRLLLFAIGAVAVLLLLSSRWLEARMVEVGRRATARRLATSVRRGFDELLVVEDDYVVGEVAVQPEPPAAGTALRELSGAMREMRVLGIRRHGDEGVVFIGAPDPDTRLQPDDVFVLYGPRAQFERMTAPPEPPGA